jgi:hypothetical protein
MTAWDMMERRRKRSDSVGKLYSIAILPHEIGGMLSPHKRVLYIEGSKIVRKSSAKTTDPIKLLAFAQLIERGESSDVIRSRLGMAYSTFTLYRREYERQKQQERTPEIDRSNGTLR